MTRLWFLVGGAVVAVGVHVAAVMAVPRVVMHVVMARGAANGVNTPFHTKRPDAASRGIPLPSPDLLYSGCVLDVTAADVAVSVRPGSDYLSLSVFDGRSDNVFVASDRSVSGGAIRLLITDGQRKAPVSDGVQPVVLRGGHGLLLLRALAADPEMSQRADEARRTLQCGPVPGG